MSGKEILSFISINSTSTDQIYLYDEDNNEVYQNQIKKDSEYEFEKISERTAGSGVSYNFYKIKELR